MPTVLADDGQKVTYQLDDGSTVDVARPAAERLGLVAPVSEAPALGGGVQAQPPAAPIAPPAPQSFQAPPIATPQGVQAAPEPVVGEPNLLPTPAEAIQLENPQAPNLAPTPEEDIELLDAPPAQGDAQPAAAPQQQAQQPPQEPIDVVARGLQRQGQARRQAADAEAVGLEQAAQTQEQANEQLAQMQAERAREAQQLQQEREQIFGDYQRAIDEFARAEVDPNRRWADLSTGRKIGAGISMALAGIGNVLQGGSGAENPVIDMIMSEIDKDVQLQMAGIERLGAASQMQRGRLSEFDNLASSRLNLHDTAMAGYLESVARQVQTIGTRSKIPQVQAKAEEFAGQLQAAAGEFGQKAANDKHRQIMAERNFRAQERQRRFQRSMTRRQVEAQEAAARAAAEAGPEIDETGVVRSPLTGDKQGLLNTSDKSARREFKERALSNYESANSLKELMGAIERHGSRYQGVLNRFLATPEGREVENLYNNYLAKKVKAISGAQATDAEFQRYKDALPLPTLLTRNTEQAYRAELEQIADSTRLLYNAYNLKGKDAAQEIVSMPTQRETAQLEAEDLINTLKTNPDPQEVIEALDASTRLLQRQPELVSDPLFSGTMDWTGAFSRGQQVAREAGGGRAQRVVDRANNALIKARNPSRQRERGAPAAPVQDVFRGGSR